MKKPVDNVTPLIWVLLGHKAGDNNQVLALAEALEAPFVIKNLKYRATELLTNVVLKSTLAGVKKKQSSEFCRPWPDIIISAGRRNEPVAKWVKQQSGGATKLIHLGRPWAALENFDLIITTPQYQLPVAKNVLVIETVLHRVTKQRLEDAEKRWAPVLVNYRKPYLVVLVGGNSGAYAFDEAAARKLAIEVDRLAKCMNASVLVSTSARTPRVSSDMLAESLQSPQYFFRWSEQQTDNPYIAFINAADALVVTGESVSMLTEASLTGKPVYMFDFGKGSDSMQYGDGVPGNGIIEAFFSHRGKDRWRILVHKLAMRLSSKRMQRNITAIHSYLISSGRAVWLGKDALLVCKGEKMVDCVEASVTRVKQEFWPDSKELKGGDSQTSSDGISVIE